MTLDRSKIRNIDGLLMVGRCKLVPAKGHLVPRMRKWWNRHEGDVFLGLLIVTGLGIVASLFVMVMP